MRKTKEITGVECDKCGDETWACSTCDELIRKKISQRLTDEEKRYDAWATNPMRGEPNGGDFE